MISKATLIGNLGKDPDVRMTPSGKKVAQFSLATSKSVNGEKKTTWHNIVVWNKLAEICERYLKKGSQVYVEGEIQYRDYEKDGQKKYITEIVCFSMQMLGSRENANQGQNSNDQQGNSGNVPKESYDPNQNIPDDDLPF